MQRAVRCCSPARPLRNWPRVCSGRSSIATSTGRHASASSRPSSVGTWVEITGTLRLCRDPDDDKFLEVALLGRADCLITGDNDLLVHDLFQGVVVCRPHVFLDRLRASQGI